MVILYSLADTFFVGQIGDPNQLAALSITFPIFTLLTAVANLFGIGANSVIARSLGKNDQDTAKKASAFGFWASFGVTAILAIVLGLFMKPILTFFKADELTFSFSARYLLWVFVIGGLPTVAGLILGHLVRAVGKTKEAGIGLSLGGIMNIILDPIFIFEKGDTLFNGALTMPFGFGMDVSGAAVATMLSNTISMVYFFVILAKIRKHTVLSINPKRFSLERKVAFDTCAVGFPAAVSVLLVSVSIAVLNGLLLGHENGNILSAAYGVTSKCGTIALHISIGIAQGVMPLIGFSYGAKNHKRVHQVCSLSFKILWIFSILFLIIVQLMPEALAGIFTPHAETIQVAAKLGIPCYDSEIIDKISAETGFAKEYVKKYGEYAISDSLYNNALAGRTYNGQSDADKLWLAQKKVVTDLASQGPCVIIGRCADYILRDIADCLTVFIHASDEKRAERIVSIYGHREDAPEKRIRDKDNKRKAYYELYTGTVWGEAENYTLCLDSGVLGTERCAEIIQSLY